VYSPPHLADGGVEAAQLHPARLHVLSAPVGGEVGVVGIHHAAAAYHEQCLELLESEKWSKRAADGCY
jgi:hypothetical protein